MGAAPQQAYYCKSFNMGNNGRVFLCGVGMRVAAASGTQCALVRARAAPPAAGCIQ